MSNATAKWWPSEHSSRRPGWTEGRACFLVDGHEWFMPKVDDSLIPYYAELWPLGVIANRTLKAMLDDNNHADEVVADFNRYVGPFINQLFEVQYDLPEQTIADLTFGRVADQESDESKLRLVRLWRMVIAWTDEMIEVAGRRLGTVHDDTN